MAQGVIPSNPAPEAARLSTLRGLRLLDTPPSETFDRVTRLAAASIDVPIVLLSLVDETRQWFKSRFNFELSETSRDASMCSHAIQLRHPLIVPDTTLDERFRDSPLVTGEQQIRAYLGVPVFTRLGHAIGALCAMDRQPHAFDAEDVRLLGDFAKIVQESIQAQELAQQSDSVLQFASERELLFRDTFELAPVGMVHTSLTGRILRVNHHLAELLGYRAGELEQVSVVDLTHPADIQRSTAPFRQLVAGQLDRYSLEKRLQRRDGTHLWCRLGVALKRAAAGDPEYLIAVVEDLSAQRAAADTVVASRDALNSQVEEQTRQLRESNEALRSNAKQLLESELALRHTEHRLLAIANQVPAMIGYWNRHLECEFANAAYRSFFGIDPSKIIGTQMRDLLGEAQFLAIEAYARAVLAGQPQRFEVSTRRPADGSEVHIDVRYEPDMESGGVRGFFVLITDDTSTHNIRLALEAANAKLQNDSSSDYLTGLTNRSAFHQRGEEAARRFGKHGDMYGVLLIDLDNFRAVNEQEGHAAGDELLRRVGALLKRQLRNHRDCAARLNGEEFGILCFGALDEELLEQLASHLASQISRGDISASIGIALSQSGDGDWRRIYARAESALRSAKLMGRGQVALGRTAA